MVEIPGYTIQHLLSWGAQGDVFLAIDAAGERVALKVVEVGRTDGDPAALQRLRREARLLRAVTSPHVVAVRALLEDERHSCLVLEYLDGVRLDRALRQRAGLDEPMPVVDDDAATVVLPADRAAADASPVRPALDGRIQAMVRTVEHVAWALAVGVQLARGVAAMHAVGLVHRDLKPANAMLVGDHVKLIDFGLARASGVTTLTRSGAVIGSFAFMSPEQFRGATATTRSDVYGLGATLHHLLYGEPPHGGDSASLVHLAGARRPPRCRRDNPAISASLAAVVERALEPDARDRYEDAGALLADLERCARGEVVRAPFSAGRLWRHHARSALWSGAVIAVLAAGALLWMREDANSRAIELLATADRPEQVKALWQQLTDAERAAVIAALNARLGDQHDLAASLAVALELGQLRLAAREGRVVALVSTPPDAAPVAPRLAEFLPIDRPRSLLAFAGRAWLLVVGRDSSTWWASDDPKCLQLAMDLPVAAGPVAERSLGFLEVMATKNTQWGQFEAGRRVLLEAVSRGDPKVAEWAVQVDGDFAVGRQELSRHAVAPVLASLGRLDQEQREVVDTWVKHPQEPADEAERFWSLASVPAKENDTQPLLVDFWTAWRLAALIGARLPTKNEWLVASRNDGLLLGVSSQRDFVTDLVAVDAPPTWDRTDKDLVFLNSNAMEWLLGPVVDRGGTPRFQVAPDVQFFGERPRYSSGRLIGWKSPTVAQGMRPYRSRVRP